MAVVGQNIIMYVLPRFAGCKVEGWGMDLYMMTWDMREYYFRRTFECCKNNEQKIHDSQININARQHNMWGCEWEVRQMLQKVFFSNND